jgi:hypothetical protein
VMIVYLRIGSGLSIMSIFGDSMATREGDLERAMWKLDLSAAERKGIKIDRMKGLMVAEDDLQAVGNPCWQNQSLLKGSTKPLARSGVVIRDW